MKSTRQAAILNLINKQDIKTQKELAEKLRLQGFDVTQATVSRDIKEMRLLKVLNGLGDYKYATADQAEHSVSDRFVRMFIDSVISIVAAGNIIVIKTLPGSANVAGEAIDSMRWPEIAGTLSGDNTIFVAVHDVEDTDTVIQKFNEILKL
ncbi:MAG: arginine repressor [Bacillota bacterium]|nr:arginine repressor [Bacillota bacterium]